MLEDKYQVEKEINSTTLSNSLIIL